MRSNGATTNPSEPRDNIQISAVSATPRAWKSVVCLQTATCTARRWTPSSTVRLRDAAALPCALATQRRGQLHPRHTGIPETQVRTKKVYGPCRGVGESYRPAAHARTPVTRFVSVVVRCCWLLRRSRSRRTTGSGSKRHTPYGERRMPQYRGSVDRPGASCGAGCDGRSRGASASEDSYWGKSAWHAVPRELSETGRTQRIRSVGEVRGTCLYKMRHRFRNQRALGSVAGWSRIPVDGGSAWGGFTRTRCRDEHPALGVLDTLGRVPATEPTRAPLHRRESQPR